VPSRLLPVGDVHGDFHAEPKINGLRGFPFHTESPVIESFDWALILLGAPTPRISSIMKLTS
jgi:hypothetical protein